MLPKCNVDNRSHVLKGPDVTARGKGKASFTSLAAALGYGFQEAAKP
jgi:hypothetical protein